jgi:RHS repeat-associated protein
MGQAASMLLAAIGCCRPSKPKHSFVGAAPSESPPAPYLLRHYRPEWGLSFPYDGFGNRVARTTGGVTTRFLIDDLTPTGYAQVAEEVVSGAVTRRYAHGPMRVSQSQLISGNWTTNYFGYDAGGTVRQLTNGSGAVTDTYDYDAYGLLISQTGSTPNLYLYRGEQWDPSLELYYLRARWMQPRTGRFITADSYEGEDDDPPSLHKYGYAEADPVLLLDPTGLSSTEKGLLSQIWTRTRAVWMQGVRMARMTAGRVRSGTETAEKVVCCLIETWSVLDLASQTGGALADQVLQTMDKACQLDGCSKNGHTPSAARGQAIHRAYSRSLDSGWITDLRLGNGLKPDAVNLALCEIRELKPSNRRAARKGMRQLLRYKRQLEKEFPGKEWKLILELYKVR